MKKILVETSIFLGAKYQKRYWDIRANKRSFYSYIFIIELYAVVCNICYC